MQNSTNRIKGSKPGKTASRLSKEQWLERALGFLEKHGPAAMTLDRLTTSMGVTTGSFYHHFGSHGRFLDLLTDKYIGDYTHVVKHHIEGLDLPPREMLIETMRHILSLGLGNLDVHFRSLAISYPRLAGKIREMDEFRMKTIAGMYEGMGYTGQELRMRVHLFVVLHSMESGVSSEVALENKLELFDERIKLIID